MTIKRNEIFGDDKFEQYLTAQLQQSQEYLMDDGFVAGLMQKLPVEKQKKRLSWQEWLILVIPTLLISSLVFSQIPVAELLVTFWVWISLVSAVQWVILSAAVSMGMMIGLVGWFMKENRILL